MGYSPWGRKEWDTTERLALTHSEVFHVVLTMYVYLKEVEHYCLCI